MKVLGFVPQGVSSDLSVNVNLKCHGKLLTDKEVQDEFGFSPEELGLQATTMPSKFGDHTGYLVEDNQSPQRSPSRHA